MVLFALMHENAALAVPQETRWKHRILAGLGALALAAHSMIIPVAGSANTLAAPAVPITTTDDRPSLEGTLKGLQADGFNDASLLLNAGTGSLVANIYWPAYENTNTAGLPCTNGDSFEGHCYTPDPKVEQTLVLAKTIGAEVVGIIVGAPDYAMQSPSCKDNLLSCVPRPDINYRTFVRYITSKYMSPKTEQTNMARLNAAAIYNEPNLGPWFDFGCQAANTCNVKSWVNTYWQLYDIAYQEISSVAPDAKIIVALTHHFEPELDKLSGPESLISVLTFMDTLESKVKNLKQFGLGIHAYSPKKGDAKFGPKDMPKATLGNPASYVGRLSQRYSGMDAMRHIYLLENGLDSTGDNTNEEEQAQYLCAAFKNIANTPGIEKMVYHRYKDTEKNRNFGLVRADGTPKPSWSIFASVRNGQDSCGTGNWPYVYYRASDEPVPSTNPSQYQLLFKNEVWLERNDSSIASTPVFVCKTKNGKKTLLSTPACDNEEGLRLFGYSINVRPEGVPSVLLIACASSEGDTSIVLDAKVCINPANARRYGFAAQAWPMPKPPKV